MEESKVHNKNKDVAKHLATMIKKEFPDLFFNRVFLFCDKHQITVKEVENMEDDLKSLPFYSSHKEVFVQMLLQSEVDLNVRNKEKDTPLHLAIRFCNLDVVQMLLDYNVDFQAQNIYGDTPLHVAVRFGNERVIQILLTFKVNLNIRNVDGDTVAHLAVRHGHTATVKKLLLRKDAGFQVINVDGETPCHIAFRKGNKAIIHALLHSKISLEVLDKNGETPVHLAVRFDKESLVQMFLSMAANIHIKNKHGNTLLHHAVLYKRTSIIQTLLQFHIDMDIQNDNYETALHFAVRDRNETITTMLVTYGANILAHNKQGESVLRITFHQSMEGRIFDLLIARISLKNINIENEQIGCISSLNSCNDEIEKMKMQKVGESWVSVYDILEMEVNVVACYLTDQMVKEAHVCALGFPHYFRMLDLKVNEIKMWYNLRNQTIKQFNNVFHSFVRLPSAAVEQILNHFDTFELKKFNYIAL